MIKKIALVGFRLSRGGSERVMANLSNFFDKKKIEVHIIIFHNELGYTHSGIVFNLGKLKTEKNSIFNKIKRFYHFNKYIKRHRFDFVIDFRFRKNIVQEILINKYIYKTKTIYMIHSSKIEVYMPNFSCLTRFIYNNCYKIVAITKSMQNLVEKKHSLKNVTTIYNPIDIIDIQKEAFENIDLKFKYIIAVGEYDSDIKQFDKLIWAYSKSILPKRNFALVILGTGKNRKHLLSIAKKSNVEEFVHLLGFKKNPFKYMKNAEFLTMSSAYEGFGMVLIEALACGTPVISFDCLTGPNEIIEHGVNGLLIENQNIEAFVEGMNTLVLDGELYNRCKKNSRKSIEKFSLENIGNQWLDLMDI